MEPGARVSERWSPGKCCYGGFAKATSTEDPITEDRMTLLELLRKSGDGDFCEPWRNRCCRSGWKPMSKALIGVGRHERTGDRLNYRSGYGERSLDTRLGSLQLRIPKLRQGHLRNALAHVPKPARHGRRCDAATFLQADAKAASRADLCCAESGMLILGSRF